MTGGHDIVTDMSTFKELMELGKELDLTGNDLRSFVKEEQDRERDRRLAERQVEKDRLEAEKDRLEADRQVEKDRLEQREPLKRQTRR